MLNHSPDKLDVYWAPWVMFQDYQASFTGPVMGAFQTGIFTLTRLCKFDARAPNSVFFFLLVGLKLFGSLN